MQYPLISEYIDAIRSAEDNFDKLSSLRPVLDSNGNPVMSVGNFAVVFKMKDVFNDRLFAVKCFIKEQEQRSEYYRLISEELNYVSSPYLLNVRYLERELFVYCESCDKEEFPVLVMEWVEGQPLDAYLKQHIDDTYDLQMLAYRFCKMGAWLLSQPFAHGDLKPDNILVREDGALVLVDYDGMYVSTMEGREACELGSPDFRHPLRDKESFDEHIDDFSIATIALSLKSIALSPQLYHQYGAADRLLFSANDYHDIGQSPALKAITALSSDSELSILLGVFLLSLAKKSLSLVSFRLLLLKEPEKPAIDVLSTEITEEERYNAIKDEYGAEYTADGLKLIRVPYNVKDYKIKDGTRVIGDNAFWGCEYLTSIEIPDSVKSIGNLAFNFCKSLTSIEIPDSVKSIGNGAFYRCTSLTSIEIPDSVKSIGDDAFWGCKSLTSIEIPDSVTSIGDRAFMYCKSLNSIEIPDSVLSIGDRAFGWCKSLSSIEIPDSVKSIGNHAFWECTSLNSIAIPDSVKSIGDDAFWGCKSLTSIEIPDSVTSIGDRAFGWCKSLSSIEIPDSVKSIGNYAFDNCTSLTSIEIPDSVKKIGGGILNGCHRLRTIVLKTSMYYIQDSILYSKEKVMISCWSNNSDIIIPNGVKSIGNGAFGGCTSLTSIEIPDSVKSIGNYAFWECTSLTSIEIPDSVKSIGNYAFDNCI